MANKRRIILGITAATVLGFFWAKRRRRRQHGRLTPAQERFIKRATVLEAQQVPFYCTMARRARRLGKLHLEVGLQKAAEVELQHLTRLKGEGQRLGIALGWWERFGNALGKLSGAAVSAFEPQVGLRVVSRIERIAASEYARARADVADRQLQQLYLDNQVDEEFLQAWAELMLDELNQGDAGTEERAAEPQT